MRKILVLSLAALFGASLASAQSAARTDRGMSVTTADGRLVEITLYSDDIARIVKYPTGTPAEIDKGFAVTMTPENVKAKYAEGKESASLSTPAMKISVEKIDGSIRFYDAKGKLMVAEDGPASFKEITDGVDKGLYNVAQAWKMDGNEPIYGLGNLENGRISQRGVNRTLEPGNVEDGITFFQSVKGYGIYWDNYSPTDISDSGAAVKFDSPVGQAVDYYYMQGGDSDGVIACARELTGRVPMLPLWTYGYWQCRERYKTQEEIMEVARKYRETGVPVDGMIQDWQYWGNNYLWNAMEFLGERYTRPQMMVDSLHNMNTHLIISIWSSFGPHTKGYQQMDSIGALFNIKTWPESGIDNIWPPRYDYPSGVRVYNPYREEARDIYWNNLLRLYNYGIDGWWMDSTEPDFFSPTKEDLDTPTGMGSFRRWRGAFPIATVGGVHDHQKAINKDRRVFILTRSGWMGQQRYGSNVWTGDVTSTWENLRAQLGAMLNFSMTGNPMTNSDLGGFFANGYNRVYKGKPAYENPAYQELYARWMQMGAFTPMMRSHGTDTPRELYFYGKPGEPAYDALLGAIKLRYSLLPYIYSTSWDVSKNHGTFMRALPMDFAHDESTWNRSDAYMFGRQLFVAPIIRAIYTPEVIKRTKTDEDGWNKDQTGQPIQSTGGEVDFTQAKTVEIALPAGADWWGYFDGKKYKGGETATIEATLATIPVFAREGAIVPIGPDVQYAEEKPWDNLTIKVFPGADGEFTLYEDEGDNYNYENGAYTEIPMKWNDKARTLTIGQRNGEYPGMIENRKFSVELPDGTSRTVEYSGKKATVKL
ncbi:MAG: DUF5110 domain-containing protein [Clostridium sp.]|nr:DUF5110 domain-containing protein [Clostridium sp.]